MGMPRLVNSPNRGRPRGPRVAQYAPARLCYDLEAYRPSEGKMATKGPYDPDTYRRFAENLKDVLRGSNIEHPTLWTLRRKALKSGRKTANGSALWTSAISSRQAAKTVYLGDETVQLPRPTPGQLTIVEKAPDQLHKVLQLLKTQPFVHIRRQMGDNKEFNPVCNLYVSVSDPKNYRLAYEWAMTMGPVKRGRPGPRVRHDRHPRGAPAADADPHPPPARHQHRHGERLHGRVQEGLPPPGHVPRRPARACSASTRAPRWCARGTAPRASSRPTASSCSASRPRANPPGRATSSASTPTRARAPGSPRTTSSSSSATARPWARSRASTSRPTWTPTSRRPCTTPWRTSPPSSRTSWWTAPGRSTSSTSAWARTAAASWTAGSSRSSGAGSSSPSAPTPSTCPTWTTWTGWSSPSSPGGGPSCPSPSASRPSRASWPTSGASPRTPSPRCPRRPANRCASWAWTTSSSGPRAGR